MRWHAHDHTDGSGHLYQGRFKTFPIEADDHLLTVLRYVERNPLRAGLCERAEDRQSPQGVASGRNDQSGVPARADCGLSNSRSSPTIARAGTPEFRIGSLVTLDPTTSTSPLPKNTGRPSPCWTATACEPLTKTATTSSPASSRCCLPDSETLAILLVG